MGRRLRSQLVCGPVAQADRGAADQHGIRRHGRAAGDAGARCGVCGAGEALSSVRAVGPVGGLAALIAQHEQIKAFHLLARPRRLAQKLQAGRHAGLESEAAHWNALAQFAPAEVVGKVSHHALKRDAVKGVAWLGGRGRGRHGVIVGDVAGR
ncbi:hypothetical protein SDC9_98498 [bioreactor metagenome]|uniref:Uncharacterized protein n=1 Tax=bioreactor metagenome TaxID=1076179 RepID=A0A645AFF4_9ZZZZ